MWPLESARLTEEHARRSAGLAALRYGIRAPLEPLRAGANHVFRAGEAVIRVAPQSVDVAGQVALARWLIAEGFAVPAPLEEAEQIDGSWVSLWEYVPADPGRPVEFEQLGEVVARLHGVAPARVDDVVPLPCCGDAAWLAIERRLADAEAVGVVAGSGLSALRQASLGLRGWRERARRGVQVVCHGDVHPRNVLMRGDEVVIVDWDLICRGPAAWDHAALIPWADRYGGPAAAYPDFARGYGADLRDSPLAQELAAVRLLAATLNTIAMAADDPSYTGEAKARMRYWTGDPAAPTWTAL